MLAMLFIEDSGEMKTNICAHIYLTFVLVCLNNFVLVFVYVPVCNKIVMYELQKRNEVKGEEKRKDLHLSMTNSEKILQF